MLCVQVARGTTQQNIDYCTKSDSKLDGPWEVGERPIGNKKKLLKSACELIREGVGVEDLPQELDTVRVIHCKGLRHFQTELERKKRPRYRELTTRVLWGPTGVGKTRWAYEHYPVDQIFKLTEPEGKLWFDGYTDQPVLLIDDFSGWIKYRHLLNLLDVYPLDLEIKGGFVPAQYTEVIITSNYHPSQWYSQHGLDAPLQRRLHFVQHVEENLFPVDEEGGDGGDGVADYTHYPSDEEPEEEEEEMIGGTPWEMPSPSPFVDPLGATPMSPGFGVFPLYPFMH